MATLNLSYSTGSVSLSELNDGLGLEWGYQATINGSPNPESKADFNRRHLGRIIREAYKNGKRKAILAAAEETVPDVNIT